MSMFGKSILCKNSISPILKENIDSHNRISSVRGPVSLGLQKYNFDGDSDSSTDGIISKLNNVSIRCPDENTDPVKIKSKTKSKKNGADKNKKDERVPTTSNKSTSDGKVERKKTEKSKTTKLRKPRKKKDSFIVSDGSSIENDSITIYHRVFTDTIKADVKKFTPRSRINRKSIAADDNGIFTPYIVRGKRSSSESSWSDKENDYDNNSTNLKFAKTETSPIELNKSVSSVSVSSDESLDFRISRKFPPPSTPKLPVKEGLKNTSWCFSDKDLSSDSEDELSDGSSKSSATTSSGDKKFTTPTADKKRLPKKKSSRPVTPAPITYRLKQVQKLTPLVPKVKKQPLSFLQSLSDYTSPRMIHPDAEPYRKKFKKTKEELAAKLFKMFNEEIFDSQLPADMKIDWNARLRCTAGRCHNSRVKNVIGPDNECVRTARIELSGKILDRPDRLRDTLIHEMCHAATWLIDKQHHDAHGPYWKAWAKKSVMTFTELPLISRCHNYTLNKKYNYKCIKCGYTIGRHSKSLDVQRKRCGYCLGEFELIVKSTRTKSDKLNSSQRSIVKARPLTQFALFVKDNYGKIKSEQPSLKHGEIMKVLSKNFAQTKVPPPEVLPTEVAE